MVLQRLPVPLQVRHDALRPLLEALAVPPQAHHLRVQPLQRRVDPPPLGLEEGEALVVFDEHLTCVGVEFR